MKLERCGISGSSPGGAIRSDSKKKSGIGECAGSIRIAVHGKSLCPAVGNAFGNRVDTGPKIRKKVLSDLSGHGMWFSFVLRAIVVVVDVSRPLVERFFITFMNAIMIAIKPELSTNLRRSIKVTVKGWLLKGVSRKISGQIIGVKPVTGIIEMRGQNGIGRAGGVIVENRFECDGGGGASVCGIDLLETDGSRVDGLGSILSLNTMARVSLQKPNDFHGGNR